MRKPQKNVDRENEKIISKVRKKKVSVVRKDAMPKAWPEMTQ
jgi:hypothetical protein